ncbi:hypothetical protein OsJ_20788 [Oryza sativa Japonica Group]|uniref:Uncharacterized protein n=1 Tax=Oryza sativa subsp. japonica TaxID=39947 RepID=B9FSG9_ORYSJ|nr:hypothetical protein OsJ_20788 [Oryza sativa Japonica Group]
MATFHRAPSMYRRNETKLTQTRRSKRCYIEFHYTRSAYHDDGARRGLLEGFRTPAAAAGEKRGDDAGRVTRRGLSPSLTSAPPSSLHGPSSGPQPSTGGMSSHSPPFEAGPPLLAGDCLASFRLPCFGAATTLEGPAPRGCVHYRRFTVNTAPASPSDFGASERPHRSPLLGPACFLDPPPPPGSLRVWG